MSPSYKKQPHAGLDAAVRDGVVAKTLPWVVVSAGLLAGLVTATILPLLLAYNSCILEPVLFGGLPAGNFYPACLANARWRGSIALLLWPWLLAALGATYGMVRRLDVCGQLPWFEHRSRFSRIRPFHLLAFASGYIAFVSAARLAGSWALLQGSPLLAVASGPAVVLVWQFLHDRLLLLLGRPSWDKLVEATVQIWLPRRLAVPTAVITRVRAHQDGVLEIVADLDPFLADEVRTLAMQLPGVRQVLVRDHTGMPIAKPEKPKHLSSAVEAARTVAQLHQQRTEMFASPSYKPRRITIYDYSGRVLVITCILIVALIASAMTWMGRRGGFRRITAEEIQWFFGKYGPGAPASSRRTLPKSLRPPIGD